MPNPRDEALRSVRWYHQRILAREERAARALLAAYREARGTLRDRLLAWWEDHQAQGGLTPLQMRRLSRDRALLAAIEFVMADLGEDVQRELRTYLAQTQELAFESAEREVFLYARELPGVARPRVSIPRGTVAVVETAVEQVPNVVDATRQALTAELRRGLIAGESFPDLVQGVTQLRLTDRASAFRRGRNSAELFVRRSVIEAENASRQLFYEEASADVPGLQKQAVAVLTPETTETCLIVHGQIQQLNDPYELRGTPRFSDTIMYPPFHWNCRTSSVGYHPDFEEGATITTQAMREAARDFRQKQAA